jgi:YwiC-like protein
MADMSNPATSEPHRPRQRSALRAVALPSEHGGWGLTAEPVLLGLLVAPSIAGAAIGAAAVLAFLVRTPLKVVLVDRWRHRRLPRTVLAQRVSAVELVALGAVLTAAASRAGRAWWAPLLAAVPLVTVEIWFDMRSRSRRIAPELCGAVAIASVAAAIARAGGAGWSVAIGLWVVLAARSVASIPFARAQVQRIKGHPHRRHQVDIAQAAALAAVLAGWKAGAVPAAGVAAIGIVAAAQTSWMRLRPPPVAVLGVTQLIIGIAIALTVAGAIRFA